MRRATSKRPSGLEIAPRPFRARPPDRGVTDLAILEFERCRNGVGRQLIHAVRGHVPASGIGEDDVRAAQHAASQPCCGAVAHLGFVVDVAGDDDIGARSARAQRILAGDPDLDVVETRVESDRDAGERVDVAGDDIGRASLRGGDRVDPAARREYEDPLVADRLRVVQKVAR
jgi:hypothetical protein